MEISAPSRTDIHRFQRARRFGALIVVPILFAAAMTLHCGGKGPTVNNTDPGLSMVGGKLFYRGKPFTGVLHARIPASREISTTPFRKGIQHGTARVKTFDGVLVSKRKFVLGVKHGVHRTWHRNGKPRMYARFRYGRYSGDFWAWHENGRPSNFKRYTRDGKILAAKRWRRTGQIYMNNVFRDGAEIGMPGSKVCDPVDSKKANLKKTANK